MNEFSFQFRKMKFVQLLLVGLFLLVFLFLFRWQIIDSKKFDEMAAERIRNVEIPALRGSIYSSDGTTLAFSERRFDIYVYIPELERAENYGKQSRSEYIKKVSEVLKMEESELRELLDSGPDWIKIASKLPYGRKEALVHLKRDDVEEFPLEGNFVEYTAERIYPENDLASHIVGFYGYNAHGDLEGRSGIEAAWEGSLKSLEGFHQEQVDSFGNTITILDFTPIEEQRGTDIYLTVDLKLQRIIEERLKWAVERYDAEAGAVLLMDPKTGAILALSNYPTFNPNKYNKIKDLEAFSNRAITTPYEFGSVGKIFTVSGAFEEGVVEPKTIILPEGHEGCEFFIDKTEDQCKYNLANCRVCTFDRLPQAPMTVAEGLIKSDNIALYNVAKKLEISGLYKYLSKFRMGEPTGIELFESYGALKQKEEWNISDLVTHSYGHGYEGTLLQVTAAAASVANEGKYMKPHIVSRIVEQNRNIREFEPEAIVQTISSQTSKIVGGILNQVYRNNVFEYYYKDLLNYDIAMKSGTALIPYKNKAGYSDEINTTYIGFDLSKQKSFILSTWLYKPKVGHLASHNSRVLWLEIFNRIKDHLNVPRK